MTGWDDLGAGEPREQDPVDPAAETPIGGADGADHTVRPDRHVMPNAAELPEVTVRSDLRVAQDANFDRDSWDYTGTDQLAELSNVLFGQADLLECYRDAYGGKAVSLLVSEAVAHLSDGRLSVPGWVGLEQGTRLDQVILKLDELRGMKEADRVWRSLFRSSSYDEDWADPSSGALQSFEVEKGDASLNEIEETLAKHPGILQQCRSGYGLVVDIGDSPLIGEPVIRIAHGHFACLTDADDDSFYYTSATWDGNSDVGVFRWSDGEAILPLPRDSERTQYSKAGKFLVDALRDSVPELLARFGLQFEVVYDPADLRAGRMNLVQTRPSPGKLRGVPDLQRLAPDSDFLSAMVSGVGDISAEVVVASDITGRRRLVNGQSIASDLFDCLCFGGTIHDYIATNSSHYAIEGKGIIWPSENDLRDRLPFRRVGARLLGARFQISPGDLLPNYAHGTHNFRSNLADLRSSQLAEGVECPDIYQMYDHDPERPDIHIGVSYSDHRKLVARLLHQKQTLPERVVRRILRRPEPQKTLRIVSDGLVGAVLLNE